VVATANGSHAVVAAIAAIPPPNTRPPTPRIAGRDTTRVRPPYTSWIAPATRLPTATR
jgi:hypothetical protein